MFYLFEPDPGWRNQKIPDGNAKFYPVAIGAQDGEIDFHPSVDGWKWSGSIRKPKEHLNVVPEVKFGQPIKVPCWSLDSWFRQIEIKRIDLIWADVQGAEVDLIKGGQHALSSTRYLYTEYSNQELYEGQITLAGILELLPDWQVVGAYDSNVLLQNRRMA